MCRALVQIIVITLLMSMSYLDGVEAVALPGGWEIENGGSLGISTQQVKQEHRSLEWEWTTGSKLIFEDEDELWGLAGIEGWLYNPSAVKGELIFQLGPKTQLAKYEAPYEFRLSLDFQGWRWFCVSLSEDAKVNSYQGSKRVERMQIIAPQGEGRLFFNGVCFSPDIPWWRPADWQAPYVNAKRVAPNEPGQIMYWDRTYSQAPRVEECTVEEIEEIRRIEARYRHFVIGTDANWKNEIVRTRYVAFLSELMKAERQLRNYKILVDGQAVFSQPILPTNGRLSDYEKVVKCLTLLATGYHMEGPNQLNPYYQRESLRVTIIELFNYLHDQGWAAGSGLGDGRFVKLALSGYANAVFLMKDVLKKAGIWEREMETLRWYCGFGQVFDDVTTMGVNADDMRTNFLHRLIYVLAQDDGPQKVRDMKYLTAWINQGLQIAPQWQGTLKPDYTGYHHSGIVGNTYTINALHTASLVVYLLHETCYAPQQEQIDNLRNCLLQARIYANMYDIPSALACRWPFQVQSLNELLPAYAYLSLAAHEIDEEMAGAFCRLWNPALPVVTNVIEDAKVGFSYVNTVGAADLLAEMDSLDFVSEMAPNGHWHMPYGGLSIHRRDEWMLSVKGWSRYVWSFESQPQNMGAMNAYGRYMSHGAIQLYCSGDPVNAQDSGYVEAGWDWNRWPGTTAINLPYDELVEKSNYARHFTDETFVGGVVMQGKHGLFAMKFHDAVYDSSFSALKSVFCFGERIVVIGSDIRNTDHRHHTETTVFQVALHTDAGSYINSPVEIIQLPYEFIGRNEPVWLVDSKGNGYYIPEPHALHVERQTQRTPLNNMSAYKRGDFEVAWFDHGKAPDGAGYEYVILPQWGLERTQAFAKSPTYSVLQKDLIAHIVHDHEEGITGYAVFQANEDVCHGGVLQKVDTPLLIMIKEETDVIRLAVCDPDLGWLTHADTTWPVRIFLNGQWHLTQGEHGSISTGRSQEYTVLEVEVTGGFSQEFVLSRQEDGRKD